MKFSGQTVLTRTIYAKPEDHSTIRSGGRDHMGHILANVYSLFFFGARGGAVDYCGIAFGSAQVWSIPILDEAHQ